MTTVDIEYCVPCGHLDQAERVQHELLSAFGRDLDGVRLTTGDGGVFKIRVDGDLVYDKREDDTGFDMADVARAVEQRV